jgi:hypothetical protein
VSDLAIMEVCVLHRETGWLADWLRSVVHKVSLNHRFLGSIY